MGRSLMQFASPAESESICQPQWSPDGVLYFVSDRTAWWNLYRVGALEIEAIYPMKAEFAEPHWVFGGSLYDFVNETEIACSYTDAGRGQLATLNTAANTLNRLQLPYLNISQVHASGTQVVLIAASETEPASVVALDLKTRELQVLRRSREIDADCGFISTARSIEFPTENGWTHTPSSMPPQTGITRLPLLKSRHSSS